MNFYPKFPRLFFDVFDIQCQVIPLIICKFHINRLSERHTFFIEGSHSRRYGLYNLRALQPVKCRTEYTAPYSTQYMYIHNTHHRHKPNIRNIGHVMRERNLHTSSTINNYIRTSSDSINSAMYISRHKNIYCY
jgi:hypothetical protein